jgi:putative endonuclease
MFGKNRNRKKGAAAEEVVARHLEKNGHTIVQRNYTAKAGEIDIITKHGGELVFVEVKSAAAGSPFNPVYLVDKKKREKIIKVASLYIATKSLNHTPIRFDVALVKAGEPMEVEIIENAFTEGDA